MEKNTEKAEVQILALLLVRPWINLSLVQLIERNLKLSKSDMQEIRFAHNLELVAIGGQHYWVDPDGLE